MLLLKVGDIDFYPNGGIASMPGCEGEPIDIQCSHARKEVSSNSIQKKKEQERMLIP